jgi:phosphoglycerate dehydrogenase-like enzyme
MRVLCQVGDQIATAIRDALPDADVTVVPADGPVADDVHGEVLLTAAQGSANLADVLEHGVRWIQTLGTGVDAFPLALVGDRTLTCSRGASAVPISEWVLATMLAFEKRLPDSWITAKPQHWNFPAGGSLGGLSGETLALVGLGGIGSAVAERALPFGMTVRALRRSDAPSPHAGIELVRSLPEVLEGADHVVVTAPSTPETRHLLDASAFGAMKPGVHLVNIARGALVDQDALRAALDDGTVARASLDTVEPEPLPEGHWMYTHPKVRLSPHISWSMPAALDALLDVFVANLRRYEAGEPLLGLVDVAAGY